MGLGGSAVFASSRWRQARKICRIRDGVAQQSGEAFFRLAWSSGFDPSWTMKPLSIQSPAPQESSCPVISTSEKTSHEARRPNVERLLITGVDRPLGASLARALADRCDVLGLYRDYAVDCPRLQTAYWPAGELLSLHDHWQHWQPHWTIHCGSVSESSWDRPLNGAPQPDDGPVTAKLVELCGGTNARLTVITSDRVFRGPRLFHEETSAATRTSPDALAVRAVEQALLRTSALVVRTHAYAWGPVPALTGYAQRSYEALVAGQTPPADGLRHATPLFADDLAELLWRAFERRLHGLYHLAGAERTSPYRFVCELAAILGLSQPHPLWPPRLSDAPEWHEETSLNSKRARRALEMSTPLLREGLQRFVASAQNDWQLLGRVATREAAA
jgi:dTDP-4-dehydrorhamnose reductase